MAKPRTRAVVLLSGGLDSTTCLAVALADGLEAHCLSVDYGQRHRGELQRARAVARRMGAASHRVVKVDLSAFGGSALTDAAIRVPKGRAARAMAADIPVTYVPARNTVMLALALAHAEVIGAEVIFVGVNAVDYSGYPDCRPEFLRAFEKLARVATKAGVEGRPLEIRAPLLRLSKAGIVKLGTRLGVDYAGTLSCYDPVRGRACGRCDACQLRRKGFEEAGLPDPTRYHRPAARRP
jgi:7-cyano-7-deazaguanine synthase